MSERKYLAAWTPCRNAPPYVNFSMEDGQVVVYARGEPVDGRVYGHDIQVRMAVDEFKKLIGEAVSALIAIEDRAAAAVAERERCHASCGRVEPDFLEHHAEDGIVDGELYPDSITPTRAP